MQVRYHRAQGAPGGGQRRAPDGMPTQVPPRRPQAAQPTATDALPTQKPVSDEPEAVAPAKWKATLKRVLAILGLILALSLVYVFLLMGEPDEDSQLTKETATQEETIRVPIAASQVNGNADLNPLAVNFGKPVLALYGSNLPLAKATLFDTAFRGGYARRLTLNYSFTDGSVLTVESVRPTAAVSLLGGQGYSLNMESLYAMAGLDAVRMDSTEQICVLARGSEAAYAVVCPVSHKEELAALLKQVSLMQPSTP